MRHDDKSSILVVNDNQDQLNMMKVLLGKAGYEVLTALDGSEGFETALRAAPDLIISDVMMPRASGIEMCRWLRAQPLHQNTPILLVSAVRVNSESAVEGLEAGADDYLENPFDPPRLVAKVARLIERKRHQDDTARLAAIVDSSDDGIIGKTLDGVITSWNAGAERIYGYAPAEAVGRSLNILLPADRTDEVTHILAQLKRGEHIKHLETVRRRKDGQLINVSLTVSPIKDQLGRIFGASTIARDITERKRAEAELRASEAQLRALFENALDAVLIADDEGSYLDANPAACSLFGVTRDEIKGRTIGDFILPGREEALAQAWKEFLTQGRQKGVFHLSRPDGSLIAVDYAATAHFMPGRHISVLRDVTEQKQAEESIRFQAHLLDAVGQAVIAGDQAGAVVYINRHAERLYGWTAAEVLGRHMSGVIPFEPVGATAEEVLSMLLGGKSWSGELKVRNKEGKEFIVAFTGSPFFNQAGEFAGIVGTSFDVTEHKQLEEQLNQSQKMEAVGRLAGGIAHDFNNLLTAIGGYSDLTLRKLKKDDPLYRNVEEIRKASDRAAALTRQLLAFSRKQILQPKVLSLNTIISEINQMLPRMIGEDIELRTNLDPHLGHVRADPGQIEQVIINLAVNARDAMPVGGKLTIETSNVELDRDYARKHVDVKPGRHVMIAVTDSGIGMDEETLTHIFEPFFTSKEVGKGTGLGLSTVHGIIKQSGGHIWVYTEVGHGTTFKLYLPRVDEKVEPVGKVSGELELPRGMETVLVVEDEEQVRNIAVTTLRMSGYHVLEAANGGEALLICRQHAGPIHLMLTDVVMPRMSGGETAHQVRLMRTEMKVLFMSGYTANSIGHHGVLDTGTAFIEKPFTPGALARKVREVLDDPGS